MLQAYISSVSEVYYKCFMWMLQMYIGMLHMLQWLYTYVANIYSKCFIYFFDICCKCVPHMLHVFYVDVAYILQLLFKRF